MKQVKMAYIWSMIRRTGTQLPWCTTVWHPYAIPKCAFFLWLALKMRLLTKDKMISFGMNVNATCLLCGCHNETAEHLFTTCPYTNMILNSSPVPISNSWGDWQQGNLTRATGAKKIKGWLYISVMVYVIWQERNSRLHTKGRPRLHSPLQ